MVGQTNINSRVSELTKILSKLIVAKLFKYRILFKDILTFLGLDYREAFITLYRLTDGPILNVVKLCLKKKISKKMLKKENM